MVLGGTRFVGRAIVTALHRRGDDVLVVHRGEHEPADLVPVRHLHASRARLAVVRDQLKAFDPAAAVDVSVGNGADADAALSALPAGIRLVALSSGDVYRAFAALRDGLQTDAVPLTEASPVRTRRHVDGPQWENLEVEERYLARGATALRLGAVYGEHDYQYRFEFVLRRLRARRPRIPIGAGTFLFSRVAVADVAAAVLAALHCDDAAGEAFNVSEETTAPYRLFAQQIIDAAGVHAELVRVEHRDLPADMDITGDVTQHLLMSPRKAGDVLGWRPSDPEQALRAAVRWHLAHPPDDSHHDFSADDRALSGAAPGA